MKFKDIALFNIICIVVIVLLYYFNLTSNVVLYLSFETNKCNFKDLLSIVATILSIFLGFIATIATVLISMCNKRIMRLIKKYKKVNFLLGSIKNALIFGFISLIGIGIVYINADFNIMIFRIAIIYIVMNCLYIFYVNSVFLIKLINKILSDSLHGDEELVVKPKIKNIGIKRKINKD